MVGIRRFAAKDIARAGELAKELGPRMESEAEGRAEAWVFDQGAGSTSEQTKKRLLSQLLPPHWTPVM